MWPGRRGGPVALQVAIETYPHERCRPFFGGLLPEGNVRAAVARRYGVSPTNDFRLLHAIGGECAGAVSLFPPGQAPVQAHEYREVGADELRALVSGRGQQPLLAGAEGVRLSLAGAQDKLPVCLDGDRVLLPKAGAPTSHILKPPIPALDGSAENEAFCTELARLQGLPVPPSRLRLAPVLLFEIERYDRTRDAEGRLVRLHQEDLCQASGIPSEAKYEAEGGPSLAGCAKILDEHSAAPAADRKALLSWVVFNVLVGNADAHAKNLSILHLGRGAVRLAPFYDLLSTRVYEGLTDRFAMKVGGESRDGCLFRRHWERLADDLGVGRRLVVQTVQAMAGGIADAAWNLVRVQNERWGPAEIRTRIAAYVEANARRVLLRMEG